MDSHLEKLTILMDKGPNDVRMIGICDMGGIGKVALAKIVSRDHGTYGTSVGTSIVGNCYKRIANLERFWGSMKSLTMLILDGTAIRELPLSVEYLTGLFVLNFKDWQNLECLPSPISENLGKVDSLEELDISGTAIRQLSRLCSLTKWDLSDCNLPVEGGEIPRDICYLCLLFKDEPESNSQIRRNVG
ncbi:hypothetical protein CISIN_1g047302mg [Citrus sinensis]|uniref:NB-ARC domain-containing protein n=1 Tax=Citrus sinensis TaxID=2711 RepID=A0A067DH20_CITSI|nr:hypothetical protein CISIN_1g047302mg [Citrus sinensis]